MRLRGERVERGIKVHRVRLDADIGGRGLRGE